MAETGKPGTNWKQVSPENRKKVSPLVKHWMKQAHPFTACFNELKGEKGEAAAKRICAVVKDMGMRSTKWRKGGGGKKVSEAVDDVDFDALVEDHFDEVIAPVLDAEGVTVDEIARWSELAVAAGVLASVEVPDDVDLDRVVEAAKKAPMSHARRRPGESDTDYGKRLKAGDAALERAQAASTGGKTRSGKPASSSSQQGTRTGGSGDFEGKHPRGRGGEWTVKAGDTTDVAHAAARHLGAKDGKSLTADAIKAFQKRHGLQVDGVIGKQTASALLGNYKGAKSVKTGKATGEQRAKLLAARKGRVRQSPDDVFELEGDEALAVTFRPSELVAACSRS
jgi:hypothetical protein